jgi:hypothetical protein
MNEVMSNGKLQGVQGYPGALSPSTSSTLLPSVASAYSPTGGAGAQQLQSQLGSAGQANPAIAQLMQAMQQQGGIGGYPTSQMQNVVGYGGTGAGGQAMSNAMQYGTPSNNAGGQNLAQLAQGYGPTMSLLAPFLQGAGKAPGAQTQFFTQPNAQQLQGPAAPPSYVP